MNKKHIGSSLRSLFVELREEEELDLLTRKKVLADQIAASMERMKLSPTALATAMHTSRTVVYRLLDPNDTGVTFETLSKAGQVLDLGHISFDEGEQTKSVGASTMTKDSYELRISERKGRYAKAATHVAASKASKVAGPRARGKAAPPKKHARAS